MRRYLRPYKNKILLLILAAVFSATANSAMPYIMGKLFDALLGESTSIVIFSYILQPFFILLGIWFAAGLTMNILSRYQDFESEKLTANVEADYNVAGAAKLLELPLDFHSRHKMGEIISRIERAGGRLSAIIGRVIINLSPDFLSVFSAFVIVFFIQPVLASVLAAALFVYIATILYVTPQYAAMLERLHKGYSDAYGNMYDAVINVRVVKQATAEKTEARKLYKNFRLTAAGIFADYIRIYSNLSFAQRMIVTITQFSLFIISFYFVKNGRLTIGELVAFNGYTVMVFGPFARLALNWDLIQSGLISVSRAERILGNDKEAYVPENPIVLDNTKGSVEFRSVFFKYGKKQNQVLRNVSFAVRAGETVALVGASGEGKSTLVDLISYYYKPTSGKIFIDGHDASRIDLVSLRSFIAVVPQEPILFHEMIKRNICYGSFNATDAQIKNAARLAHADEFIEKFPKKYNQKVGDRGIKLSAGQKQRIVIARAILRDPKILILDEPTSALDAESEKYISESLERLMEGRTTFIIAHRLSTVRKADKILVLDGGKIIERGSHAELLKILNGAYRRLYELQIGLQ